jgi:hypothetical protein
LAIEDKDKVRQEIQSLKLALVSADPAHYIPQFYPEILSPTTISNVDEIADNINAEETPIIDFDLTPPPSDEAAAIIARLLDNKTVSVREP